MSNEKRTKHKVKRALKARGLEHYCPLDAGRSGIPDVFVHPDVWIELKHLHTGQTLSHPMSVAQAHFLATQNAAGGVGVLLVELPDGAWHVERIHQIKKVTRLDWDGLDRDEAIERILKMSTGLDFGRAQE